MSRGGASGVTDVDVVVTYLELYMTDVPIGAQHAVPVQVDRTPRAAAATVAARMYRAVGAPWHWTDRLPWTDADWDAAVNRDDVELWVANVDREVAGYFELQVEGDAVELKYLGLTPEFTGRGIGGALLSAAIERARALGKARLTVNTCTLDHPAALPNYLKHGFNVCRCETQRRSLPA
jgi:ribosomal protein S18 acetylase RimI-like enzyme